VRACDPLGGELYPVAAQMAGGRLRLALEPHGPVAFYQITIS
jgi:hypothetical protein